MSDFMGPARASCSVLTITAQCPYGDHTMLPQCVYGLRAYDFFQICHCAELYKIVEATMPVNPYDDRKVSLRRPHLDIVRASYTRRKANVIEAFIRSGNTPTYTLVQTGNPPTYILVRTRKPFHTLVWTRKPHIP